jgi:prophage regulatory protein
MSRRPTRIRPDSFTPDNVVADGVQGRAREDSLERRAGVRRLLRFPDVRRCTGLSRSTIWRLERRGDFPKHRRISANAVAWAENEVLEWIRLKISFGP